MKIIKLFFLLFMFKGIVYGAAFDSSGMNLKRDGSNSMSGSLDMSSNTIVNVSTITFINDMSSGGVQYGTLDGLSRSQIWNARENSVLRLGSLVADGDSSNVTSEGIVVYGKNLFEKTMDSNHFGYARIKPDRIGLYHKDSDSGGYDGYFFQIDGSSNVFTVTSDSGTTTMDFNRNTGAFDINGTISGDDVSVTYGITVASITCSNFLQLDSQTEAELKALVPSAAGQIFYDSTNQAIVVSTGTSAGEFGLITDGSFSPTGW